jgi:hypothetical protein
MKKSLAILGAFEYLKTMTPPYNDFIIQPQYENFEDDIIDTQERLRVSGFNVWLDQQEKNHWEDLAKKSEGFPCIQ